MLKIKRNHLELIISLIIFIFVSYSVISTEREIQITGPMYVGAVMLYIVFLELVKSIFSLYLNENTENLKFIYIGGIVFILREILLILSINNHLTDEKFLKIFLLSGLLMLFAYLHERYEAKTKIIEVNDNINPN